MYDYKAIDPKWQERWERSGIFHAQDHSSQPKLYILVEFPYPSGAGLHVGHPRSYTAFDIVARKARMQGNNVLFPMGWDAFGLPTENTAVKTGVHPKVVTKQNTDTFRRQLKAIGFSFDWSREINTTDPAYYKWTQWMFLQFFKAGLTYKAKMAINWCPSCKIGLANEEAVGGVCERCNGPVEKREKEQWMIAITKYAERLLNDLKDVNCLPKIKKQQEDWIGKSEGAEIDFAVETSNVERRTITVFTTRPDTLFGATYLVLAPEHPLVDVVTTPEQRGSVLAYVAETRAKTDMDRGDETRAKTGVATGAFAVNPGSGERIPIWVADYVLPQYGTGAIMAVPAHDERDFAFAETFALPVVPVVAKHFIEPTNPPREGAATVRRSTVHAIVKRKSDGAILMLKWKANQRPDGSYPVTLIIGGVEEGENGRDAVMREIAEETGLTQVAFVRELPIAVQTEYYAGHKQENRYADIRVLVFETDGGEDFAYADDEKAKHDPVWVPFDEAGRTINVIDGPYIWSQYLAPSAMTEKGVLVNSGNFSGMASDEAANAIIEKVGARKRVTYKLRDWVFSRQRYWGEPIPLVWCDACAAKKYRFVLIHGLNGSPEADFFPKLIERLVADGHEVFAPQLPSASKPSVDEQVEYILANTTFTENTIVVGHSLGTVVMHKLLAKLSVRVAKAVFVDGLVESRINIRRPEVAESTDWVFDFVAAREHVGDVIVLGDRTASVIPHEQNEALAKAYGTSVEWIHPGEDHFCADDEPAVMHHVVPSGWQEVRDLPLELPDVERYQPTDTGESPLATIASFVTTTCPTCGSAARRETDTMPNWAGSSWYFLRYIDPHNNDAFASVEKLKTWMPVDVYNGGMEHTTLHLLYSRFWNKVLFDRGLVPTSEPYARRHSHGLIMAEDGTKMSKSKGNVVNPDDIVGAFGADTLRMYEVFMGPFEEPVPWSTNGVVGVRRFLDKVVRLSEHLVPVERTEVTKALHKTIAKVTDDIDSFRFNTAVAALMTLANSAHEHGGMTKASFTTFLSILVPFAPHVANECYERLGGTGFVEEVPWPISDAEIAADRDVTIAVQVNGKLRGIIVVPVEANEATVIAAARADENVAKYLTDEPRKTIVVGGKLINFVVN